MKAIGYVRSLPPSDPNSLFDFELPKPAPGARDLLVAVHAVSVNPVDTKVRMRAQGTEAQPKILGFDCAGIVTPSAPKSPPSSLAMKSSMPALSPSRHQQ